MNRFKVLELVCFENRPFRFNCSTDVRLARVDLTSVFYPTAQQVIRDTEKNLGINCLGLFSSCLTIQCAIFPSLASHRLNSYSSQTCGDVCYSHGREMGKRRS